MPKTIIVVDTSVVIKWLTSDKEEYLDQSNAILMDIQSGKVQVIAPELVKYEVGNVLLLGKHLTPSQSAIALGEFFNLPITFIPESEGLAIETYKIAYNLGITYYDASFLALSKQYDATLITENIKHQGKTKDIKVKALKDY
jgi:predicted nucleic acid-binding protein